MSQIIPATYLRTYLALLVLLVATVAVSLAELGALAVPAALAIATAKTVLIVLYFMHIRYEAPLVRIYSVAGAFWLGLLFLFLMADYVTRESVQRRPSPLVREPPPPLLPTQEDLE